MPQIAELGFLPLGFLVQPRLRIGLRLVRFVGALLAVEVTPGLRITIVIAFAAEALLPGPGLDQGAVDRKVFVRHQPRRLRLHLRKK